MVLAALPVAGRETGEVASVQIIVVDKRLSLARTLTLSPRMFVAAATGLGVAVLLAVIGLYVVTFRAAVAFEIPYVRDLASTLMRGEIERNEQFVRDNVTAMARRLGEMQAQLMRLDALGERVSKLAGIRPEEFNFRDIPGRGGAEPRDARPLSIGELNEQVERVAKGVESRTDYLDVVESELLAAQVRTALLPQNTPVSAGFVGSGFGSRLDPLNGQLVMHAGLDFAAPVGTPILAAAGGVVSAAEYHSAFGNMVVIDHGNGLQTLYAHASRLDVRQGEIVRKGQQIGRVGATGRSTGPHLHFEVHDKGVPQNPARFLSRQTNESPLADLKPPRR
jgi:murein DD-endopeptidase MepM/ murein hydrolase activator NlpD